VSCEAAKSDHRSYIDAIDAIRAMHFMRGERERLWHLWERAGIRPGIVCGADSRVEAYGWWVPTTLRAIGGDRVIDNVEVARLVVLAVNIGNRRVNCR
jgi:hypothetical protein